MSNKTKYLSGAEFKLHFAQLLRELKDNDQVTFGSGDLSFFQLRERGPIAGPRIVQVEFNEVYKVIPG